MGIGVYISNIYKTKIVVKLLAGDLELPCYFLTYSSSKSSLWRKQVRYGVTKFVMMSKICHDIKQLVVTS